MAGEQIRQRSVIGWGITAWRDAFDAVSKMPVALSIATLAVLALIAVTAPLLERVEVGGELLGFLVGIVQGFLLTPVAIAVHRFVLLGERAGGYRLDPREPRFWRFFVFTVIIQVIIAVPSALVGAIDNVSGPLAAVVGVLGFALLIVALIVMLRTLILFPAIAVDAKGTDWGNALRDSKGHSWRLLFIVIVVGTPLIVVYLPFFFWLWWPDGPTGTGAIVMAVLEAVETVLATAAYAALASRLFAALGDRLTGSPAGASAQSAA
jgi:hypothetical protein